MVQKNKTLQDIFRERQMKDMRREYYFYRLNQFFIGMRRLALIGVLAYGGYWLKEPGNRTAFKKFLNAPVEQINNFSVAKDFKEGMNIIKDTLGKKESDKSYFEHREKVVQEYKKLGIDVNVKYAVSGTKEFKEELEYYRKSGVFDAGK